jgi:hypothetical protein
MYASALGMDIAHEVVVTLLDGRKMENTSLSSITFAQPWEGQHNQGLPLEEVKRVNGIG